MWLMATILATAQTQNSSFTAARSVLQCCSRGALQSESLNPMGALRPGLAEVEVEALPQPPGPIVVSSASKWPLLRCP